MKEHMKHRTCLYLCGLTFDSAGASRTIPSSFVVWFRSGNSNFRPPACTVSKSRREQSLHGSYSTNEKPVARHDRSRYLVMHGIVALLKQYMPPSRNIEPRTLAQTFKISLSTSTLSIMLTTRKDPRMHFKLYCRHYSHPAESRIMEPRKTMGEQMPYCMALGIHKPEVSMVPMNNSTDCNIQRSVPQLRRKKKMEDLRSGTYHTVDTQPQTSTMNAQAPVETVIHDSPARQVPMYTQSPEPDATAENPKRGIEPTLKRLKGHCRKASKLVVRVRPPYNTFAINKTAADSCT